jgi:bacterioferritin-associated ferredoxin
MIVCHCNCIKSDTIETSAIGIAAQGLGQQPTPEQVYEHLGVQPCCRGCFPLASRVIADIVGSSAGRCTGDVANGAAHVPAE